jgi:CheY-like chemotaxis protein
MITASAFMECFIACSPGRYANHWHTAYPANCKLRSGKSTTLPRIVKGLRIPLRRREVSRNIENMNDDAAHLTAGQAHEATARVLLIDDDRSLGSMLTEYLATEHLELAVAGSGESGLRKLVAESFDLLILDIMLPGQSGLDVLRELRRDNDIPVIMLTARGDDVDRIIGLEFGADDYLSKPFNPRELTARVKAILRRARGPNEAPGKIRAGGIEIDSRKRGEACQAPVGAPADCLGEALDGSGR